ncbi:MFS transporter [Acerihabitans sp. KWT182]|uniref:MFS transporter n=1 Tax=Acerihabitans sp. KWT182 TaxID=3157919 RepID=A0AAU7QB94_9GAMM
MSLISIPAAASEKQRRFEVLAATSGVSFMIMLDANIVAVSLPSIAGYLHSAFSGVEWVVSAYILAFVACLLPAGAIADRLGRKNCLRWGLAIFTLASVFCGLSESIAQLNIGRALQGIGAALQLSSALAVLGQEFQGHDRAKAFAVWGVVIGVAATAGPIVGGIITAGPGWQWAFLINAPIGLALFLLSTRSVNESKDALHARLDIGGALLFAAALTCFATALIDGGNQGFGLFSVKAFFLAGALLFTVFICVERRRHRPMLDLGLFRRPAFIGSSLAMFAFASTCYVMTTYLPVFLQGTFFSNPAETGLALMPFSIPFLAGPWFAARLSHNFSGRGILVIGLLLAAAGNAAVAWAATGSYLFVAIGMCILGLGAGLLNGETARVSMQVVPVERAGMASGLASTVRFVGLLVSLTGLGAVLTMGISRYFVLKHSYLPQADTLDLREVVHHVAAGQAGSWLTQNVPVGDIAPWLQTAHQGFIYGFSLLMACAALIAALSALGTFILLGRAPQRL